MPHSAGPVSAKPPLPPLWIIAQTPNMVSWGLFRYYEHDDPTFRLEAAGVVFVDEDGGGPGVRLRDRIEG